MRSNNFQRAVEIILRLEGGDRLHGHPSDPGGQTKFGISQRAFPTLDIPSLTRESAEELYHRYYWLPVHGDNLPWPLCLYMFDAAVNQGVAAAIEMLQREAGVPVVGLFGRKTLEAIAKTPELAVLYLARRALRYYGTRGFDVFGRGWLARLFRLSDAAA